VIKIKIRDIHKRIKELKAKIKDMKTNKTRLWSNRTIEKKEYCLNMLETYLRNKGGD